MPAPYGYNIVPLDRTGWTATVSDATYGPASDALDGNTGTIWATNGGFPAWIVVDMKAPKTFDAVQHLPRQDSFQDRPGSIEIYVSADGATWGTAVYTESGLPNTSAQKTFPLPAPVTFRWVKYNILSAAAGARAFQGAAEFYVGNRVPIYVIAPPLVTPCKGKHQRVRAPSAISGGPVTAAGNSGFTG